MTDPCRRDVLRFTTLMLALPAFAGCGGGSEAAEPLAAQGEPVAGPAPAPTPAVPPAPTPAPAPSPTPAPLPAPPPPPAAPPPLPPTVSMPVTEPLAEVAVPAWRRGQAVGAWREVAGSAMGFLATSGEARTTAGRSAVVGASARMDAWCGLSVDTRGSKVWSLANGGHGDYYGNEVCTIDLMADSPVWAEWFASSSGNAVQTEIDVPDATSPSYARYLDGKPSSRHSYYGQQFLERQNRALTLGGSMSPRGSGFENVEAFNVLLRSGANGWAPAGTFGFAVGGVNGGWTPALGWCVCKDPITECIYTITAPYIRRFTPAVGNVGGTWSILGVLPHSMNSGAMGATAVDTRRNRLLWVKGYGPGSAMVCNLATGAWTENAFSSSEAKGAFEGLAASMGMVYVPQIDKFLARANAAGSTVYAVDPVTFAVTYLTTTGGESVPRGAVLPNEEGIYNRWLYVPALSGVVYFASSASNAWFLRLF